MTDNDVRGLPWFVANPKLAIDRYLYPRRFVVLDFETTNKEKGSALENDNHIVLACWYVVTPDGVEKKYKFADEYALAELEADIKEAEFCVAWNAKFELQWMMRMGIDVRDVLVFDGFLAEWVIGGNRYGPSQLGLDASSKRYGLQGKQQVVSNLISGGVCPSEIPTDWLLEYCFDDVEMTYQVFLKQQQLLHEQDHLLPLILVRNLTCACLADMEHNACILDPQRVSDEYERTVDEYRRSTAELAKITGGVNLRSGKQKLWLLYEKLGFEPPKDARTKKPIQTDKGVLSTTVDTLALLKPKNKEQQDFLRLYTRANKLNSLLTKNLNFFKGVVDEYGGAFRGIVNQGFTRTGRLSSSGRQLYFAKEKKTRGTQLHNQPREYKKLFFAPDDEWLCGEADGAQLEFRVGAQLSLDPTAIEEIEKGADVHAFTAEVLTEAGEPGFAQLSFVERRQRAKPQTFSPMYGGGGKSKATKAYAQFFRNKYNQLFRTQESWTHEVLSTGKLRTPYGMVFYWPGTKMSKSGYIDNTTSIFNYPIQGFATGEIIPIALIYFWHRTRDLPIILWNTVHDSIVSRLHVSAQEEYERLSKHCLTTDVYWFLKNVYKYDFVVPLGVGVKVGKHWGEADVEKQWNVWPDGRETYTEK